MLNNTGCLATQMLERLTSVGTYGATIGFVLLIALIGYVLCKKLIQYDPNAPKSEGDKLLWIVFYTLTAIGLAIHWLR